MAWTGRVRTWVPGNKPKASEMNKIEDNILACFPYDAAGQIAVSTAADAVGKVAAGSYGELLGVGADGQPDWGGLVAAFGNDATTGNILNNGTANVTFDSEKLDTHGFIDIDGAPTRITIPASLAGTYLLIMHMPPFITGVATYGKTEFHYYHKNSDGVQQNTGYVFVYAVNSYSSVSGTGIFILQMSAGDYIEAAVKNYTGQTGATGPVMFGILKLL